MTDLTPRVPERPLLWSDITFDLQDLLSKHPTPIYIVGGAVRDAYLHRPLKDLDLVTPGDAIALAKLIANRMDGDFYPLDPQRGVGRALIDTEMSGRLTIDVARFRGDDLLSDLTDRDFTLNAMAVDLRGDLNLLIDPLGGERDIKDKRLRRCSPNSLAHDPVRTLRAVRQSVQLAMRIDPDTLRDIRSTAPGLANASPERVRDELFNIFSLAKPGSALRVIETLNLLAYVIPGERYFDHLRQESPAAWTGRLLAVERLTELLVAISPARTDNSASAFGLGVMVMQLDHYRAQLQTHLGDMWANGRTHRALLALAALLDGDSQSEQIAEALRLSNSEAKRLKIIAKHRLPEGELTPLIIHYFWREAGKAGIDICLLTLVKYLAAAGTEIDHDAWLMLVERVRVLLSAYYEEYDRLVEPPVLLDGTQLMEILGLKPGKRIKLLLDAIREAQVTGEVQSFDDALQLARSHINHSQS